MGSFEEHMKYGVGSYLFGVLVFGTISLTIPSLGWVVIAAVVCLPITLAGAAFPDIDHPMSKPYRFFKQMLFLSMTVIGTGVFGALFFGHVFDFVSSYTSQGEIPVTLSVMSIIGLGVGGISIRLFDYVRPPHRGMTHRVPIGVALSFGITVLVWLVFSGVSVTISGVIGSIAGGMFFFGFMSHLLCDRLLLKPKTYFTIS